ncbi:hypothetical protein AXG93_669s1310 [Marchantia polymorpha subsp. ruderalis]|uniref:RCC1-like domain-containing protein n=1 Tax=Marchantia polymorpha subsp. ruderalis TaxID=1480154 RepID=A0A176WBH9_MARPO|nr:hypothetical protein AXG93_669s1310 [Marchantia polymorpha subsp. ruderalis]
MILSKGITSSLDRQHRNFSGTSHKGLRELNSATRVLSFGDGSNGALGHDAEGYASDVFEPVPVHGLPPNIVKVAAGHYHSLAVTDDGQVWAWGRNAEGQLGRRVGNSREDWRRPRRVEGLEDVHIKDVAASGVVSMAIANDGSLWSWGSSKRGQLGLAPNVVQSLLPQRVESLQGQQMSQVALGWGHGLACTSEGELFAWGYGEDGRLGFNAFDVAKEVKLEKRMPSHTSSKPAGAVDIETEKLLEKEKTAVAIWRPHRVEALAHERVRSVACGMDHSLSLTDNGDIYSFGDNSLGQLGRPVNEAPIGTVAFPDEYPQAIVIAAGLGHSLAILSKPYTSVALSNSSGDLYSWGWNKASQLGRDGESDRPGLVVGLDEEMLIAAKGGRVHSVGLTSNREVCVWGSGKNGRLGLGSSADEPYPFPIESLNGVSVLQLACGFDHSLLLVRSTG